MLAQAPQEQQVKTKFEHGQLSNGQPKGEWKYYDFDGNLDLSINYDTGRITYMQPDSSRHLLRIDEQWQVVRPSRVPRLLGSYDRYAKGMSEVIRYPANALRSNIQGTVRLAFTVSRTGEIVEPAIEAAPSPELAQEVLRAIGAQNDAWIPAVYKGHTYDSRLFLLVHFEVGNTMRTPGIKREDAVNTGNLSSADIPRPVQEPGRFLEVVVTGNVGLPRR
jgi:protein TonB